jgi:antitoxin VapB
MKKARLFSNGGSQAVRLPAEFRFEGDHVYVRRDEATGDVVLSNREISTWKQFQELQRSLGMPAGELTRDPLNSETRNPFEGWSE